MLLLSILLFAQSPEPTVVGHCGTPLVERLSQTRIARPLAGRAKVPVKLGDQRNMWLFNMSVMPPSQVQRMSTCRGIGDHCYLFVEDSSWTAGQMDSTDVAFILERFDHRSVRDSTKGVWQHNVGTFGDPPDTDNDSLVYLMYYDVGSFHGYTFDGFWMFFDEYPDSIAYRTWGYHSNECEIVYLDDYPNDPGTDYRVAIAAHEFEHMIHWNYDQRESLWVNEGCAEMAMWLYGSPDPISQFNNNPDNDLIIWDGEWADYVQTYLFFLYLYEQYGERVGQPLMRQIVANQGISVEGVDSALAGLGITKRFEEIFNDWILANYLDDTLAYGGRFGYYGAQMPAFNTSTLSNYPVNNTNSLHRWAGKYFRFMRGTGVLNLGFDGADGSRFKAWVILRDTINRVFTVDSIPLDSLLAGSIEIPGFGTTWHYIYLVPGCNVPEGGTQSFRYTAALLGVDEETSVARPAAEWLTASRQGRTLRVSYAGSRPGRLELKLQDAAGRQVLARTVAARTGPSTVDLDLGSLGSGAYFLVAGDGDRQAVVKVALAR